MKRKKIKNPKKPLNSFIYWLKEASLVIAFFVLILSVSTSHAQEVIATSGGDASGTGGSASYSVGQVVYSTYTGTNGYVAEGVQQPFEISVPTGIKDTPGIELSFIAYPNPTSDLLYLKVDADKLEGGNAWYYQLYQLDGKLIQSKRLVSQETGINMTKLVPGTYVLKVVQTDDFGKDQEIKVFKIIKN